MTLSLKHLMLGVIAAASLTPALAADPFLAKPPSSINQASSAARGNIPSTITPIGQGAVVRPGVHMQNGGPNIYPYPTGNTNIYPNPNNPYPNPMSNNAPMPYQNGSVVPNMMPGMTPIQNAGPEIVEEAIDMEWKGIINGQHLYASRDGGYVNVESAKKKTYKRAPKVSFVPKTASPAQIPAVPNVNNPNSTYPLSQGNPQGLPSAVGSGKPN